MQSTTASTWLAPAEAAQHIGLTERTLTAYRTRGTGPRYSRLGGRTGRVRYDVRELDRWMREREHTSTAAETVGT